MTTESLIVELDGKVQKFQSGINKAAASVKGLGNESKITENKLDSFNKTAVATAMSGKKISNSMGGIGRSAGQAGIQLQQFVGQVQGGQSAMLALSQQGADLGFVLGAPLAGAVIGIGASIAGFLLPSLIGASVETKDLVENLRDFEDVSKRTAAQNKVIANDNEANNKTLSNENEIIAKKIKLLEEEQDKRKSAGTGTQTGEFAVPLSAEQNQKRYAKSIQETQLEIDTLRGKLDLNNQTIIANNEETSKLNQANEESVEVSNRYSESLQKQIIALESGAQAAEIYAATQEAIKTGQEEELEKTIAMINKKYELIEAEKALSETKREAQQEEGEFDKFLESLQKQEEAEAEAEELRLERLREFSLTKEEIIVEGYIRDLERLAEYQAAVGDSDEDLYNRRLELASKFNKDLQGVRKGDVKDTEETETKKEITIEQGAKAATQVAGALFGNNKIIQSAGAIIDTLSGVNKALASNNLPLAAVIGAAGFANVAQINATEPGGGGGGANIPTAPTQQADFQQETTTLDVRSVAEGQSSSTQRVSLSVDDSEDFLDALAEKIATRTRAN